MYKSIICLVNFACILLASAFAQTNSSANIFNQLKTQDSIFFEKSFNQCDFEYLQQAIADDFIFYHDQSGIQDRAMFLYNTQKYICPSILPKPIRKVVEESLAVFPLYNEGKLYGVIQTGEHHFYLRTKDTADKHTASAKFIHLYLLINHRWILKQVMSFNHQSISN